MKAVNFKFFTHRLGVTSTLLLGLFFLLLKPSFALENLPGGPALLQLGLQTPATAVAREVEWLHWLMLVIITIIFIAVFGTMFYSIYKHRKSKGAVAANFHESTAVEIAWTVVPLIIIIIMAIPATKAVIAMKDSSNADLTVKVTGYQWQWSYDYLRGTGEGISFYSKLITPRDLAKKVKSVSEFPDNYLLEVDNPMVVPVNKKIRIITTAADVIHSWAIPRFAVKIDAIPGYVRDAWFKAEAIGDYYGQCSELCGKDHAYMPIHVKVVSDEDYQKWTTEKLAAKNAAAEDPNKTFALEELMLRGEKVYLANCAACHQPDGKGLGTFLPLDGSAVVKGPAAEQLAIVLNGRNTMPAWKAILNDVEIAAVISYTRNAWGNAGLGEEPLVQPAQAAALR